MTNKIEHLCVFCGGKVVSQKKRVDFWWGDKLSIFEDVLVGVCQECGEEYFDAKISKEMERKAINRENVIKEIVVPVIAME